MANSKRKIGFSSSNRTFIESPVYGSAASGSVTPTGNDDEDALDAAAMAPISFKRGKTAEDRKIPLEPVASTSALKDVIDVDAVQVEEGSSSSEYMPMDPIYPSSSSSRKPNPRRACVTSPLPSPKKVWMPDLGSDGDAPDPFASTT